MIESIKDSMIDLAMLETDELECLAQFLIPTASSLLDAIDRLKKECNKVHGARECIFRWLPHVDYLILVELTIQVCTFDVHLFDFPAFACCKH